MKRLGSIALIALMGIIMMVALAGCGQNDEKVIRDSLTKHFDQLGNPSSDQWSGLMGELSEDTLAVWLDGFAFEVNEIAIDGNSATITVTITCKQLYPAVQKAQLLLQEDTSLASMTTDEIKQKANERYQEELSAAQPVTTEVTIPCTKNDNIWVVPDSGTREYTNAMLGSQLAPSS